MHGEVRRMWLSKLLIAHFILELILQVKCVIVDQMECTEDLSNPLLLVLQFQNSPLPQFENIVKLKVNREHTQSVTKLYSYIATTLSIDSFALEDMNQEPKIQSRSLDASLNYAQKFLYLSVIFNGATLVTEKPHLSILGNRLKLYSVRSFSDSLYSTGRKFDVSSGFIVNSRELYVKELITTSSGEPQVGTGTNSPVVVYIILIISFNTAISYH